jgi:hypothetical protein
MTCACFACVCVGWFDLGLIHRAEITGILGMSSSSIFYIFGDEQSDNFSGEFTLFIPPAAGEQPPASKNRGTTVAFFDDMGRGSTDDVSLWTARSTKQPEQTLPLLYTMSIYVAFRRSRGTRTAIHRY